MSGLAMKYKLSWPHLQATLHKIYGIQLNLSLSLSLSLSLYNSIKINICISRAPFEKV